MLPVAAKLATGAKVALKLDEAATRDGRARDGRAKYAHRVAESSHGLLQLHFDKELRATPSLSRCCLKPVSARNFSPNGPHIHVLLLGGDHPWNDLGRVRACAAKSSNEKSRRERHRFVDWCRSSDEIM